MQVKENKNCLIANIQVRIEILTTLISKADME